MESRAARCRSARSGPDRRNGRRPPAASAVRRDGAIAADPPRSAASPGGPMPDIADRLVMIDRFEVILERLAGDCDPVLDDQGRLGGRERIPIDRIRGVGEFEIVDMLEIAEGGAKLRANSVQLRLLDGDPGK